MTGKTPGTTQGPAAGTAPRRLWIKPWLKPWLRWPIAAAWSAFSLFAGLETMRRVDEVNNAIGEAMRAAGPPWPHDLGFPVGLVVMALLLFMGYNQLFPNLAPSDDLDEGGAE